MHLFGHGTRRAALYLLAAVLPTLGAAAAPQDANNENKPVERPSANLTDYTVQDLALPSEAGEAFAVTLSLDGVEYTAWLEPYSLRAENFRLLVATDDGLFEAPAPAPRTYRGRIVGIADSHVSASLSDAGLTATIDIADDTQWYVQPSAEIVDHGVGSSEHVVYRADDFAPGPWRCGVTDEPSGADLPDPGGAGPADGTGLKITEIAIDADFEFFSTFNGSSVERTLLDVERVMNAVETIYERDVQITYEITAIVVRTTSGANPYTTNDPGGLLTQFANHWNRNLDVRSVRRDVAHLFTGRNLSGSTIGIATLSTICIRSDAYGVSQTRWTSSMAGRSALTAHEIGHNWAAQHCSGGSCFIMCAGLGGCGGYGLPNFGSTSISRIRSFRNSRNCLTDLAPPLAPPFFDDFNGAGVDPAKWSHNAGTFPSNASSNPPFPPNALLLNSTGSGAYGQDDEIRSNFINMSGMSNMRASYYTEHRGVEAGKEFIVEFRANNLAWVELNRIVSDGVDQDQFEFHEHVLPAAANHAEFRLRFRTDGDESNDSWYLDAVSVHPGPPSIQHEAVEVPISAAAIADEPLLAGARTIDLRITIDNADDWTGTTAVATIDGEFYQDPSGAPLPLPALWPGDPSLEFDSFWSAPNFAPPLFGLTDEQPNRLEAQWADFANTGNVTFTAARYTVLNGNTLTIIGASTLAGSGSQEHPFDITVELGAGCPGDLDGDGDTDLADLGILLADFGCPQPGPCVGDLDGDGDTDLADLGILLADFGCAP